MGELSKSDAEILKNRYIYLLEQTILEIHREFAEMQLVNTDKNIEMQRIYEDTIRVCTKAQRGFSEMVFGAVEDYE